MWPKRFHSALVRGFGFLPRDGHGKAVDPHWVYGGRVGEAEGSVIAVEGNGNRFPHKESVRIDLAVVTPAPAHVLADGVLTEGQHNPHGIARGHCGVGDHCFAEQVGQHRGSLNAVEEDLIGGLGWSLSARK